MADQCIVCLDNLDVQQPSPPPQPPPPETPHHNHGTVRATFSESASTAGNGPMSPWSSHTEDDGITNDDNNNNTTTLRSPRITDNNNIAVIQVCGHVLHDSCLREWTGKANSCPICRQAFHLVNVYDRVGGKSLARRLSVCCARFIESS